ncbi:hypothetical protein [Lentzea aerocolonigenes]|uniref:hypothetical protein n=1 Tax=Lentzea aerocolonigenes TaxID=68170 RepID=UPI0012E18068|nr:hypothetical protein [Lentzea aerocolonigenes]
MKKTVVALAVLGTAFALTPIANAQEDVTPSFGFQGMQRPGAQFKITIKDGTCPGGPVSLTSAGFTAVDLPSLTGTFVDQVGNYTATLKCKDTTEIGELSYSLAEAQTPRTDPFLDKAEYAPGEQIKIYLQRGRKCSGPATSPGFAAPAELTQIWQPENYPLTGETTAGTTPGTYQAKIQCITETVTNTFTVKAPPTTGTTNPPAPKPGAKAPVVKPKGAPQTGGGGTA